MMVRPARTRAFTSDPDILAGPAVSCADGLVAHIDPANASEVEGHRPWTFTDQQEGASGSRQHLRIP
jgi:hypothetical protein